MPEERKPFEIWAVIELFGHKQVAGRVTEEPLFGTALLRVDVPAVSEWPAHTKYFGGTSIYAVHPCSEEVARATAERLAEQYGYTPMPVAVPELNEARRIIREAQAARGGTKQLAPAGSFADQFDDDDDDDDFDEDDLPL
jgi:hypothetical protein